MNTYQPTAERSLTSRLIAIVAGFFRVLGKILAGLWAIRTAVVEARSRDTEDVSSRDDHVHQREFAEDRYYRDQQEQEDDDFYYYEQD